jgi:hypothetical protein
LARDKTPSLTWIKKSMVDKGDVASEIELTLKSFRRLDEGFLHEAFEEEFIRQLSQLKGTDNLHNEPLEKLVNKIIRKIEKENQRTLDPLNTLEQTLKQTN